MACAGTSVSSSAFPRFRERELHPLLLVAFRKVFVSSSRFVLRLATVQAVCNLARVVLELHRLDEICVPLEVSLSTVIHDLALPHDVLQHRLAFVETCP